jgi:hypothetical protein
VHSPVISPVSPKTKGAVNKIKIILNSRIKISKDAKPSLFIEVRRRRNLKTYVFYCKEFKKISYLRC